MFFRIGASFEQAPWFRALGAAKRLEIADARGGVDLIPIEGGAGPNLEPGTPSPSLDPHIWTSPRRLATQARTVAATLTRLDPAGRDLYDRRLGAVTRELEALDRELAAMLEPYRGRAFFVFHPTWGYLATDYGLRQIAVEAEGKEPADSDLTRLIERARVERPRALVVEPQVPSNVAEAVAGAMGATVVRHDSLAADLPANLRRVALSLVEAFAPPARTGDGPAVTRRDVAVRLRDVSFRYPGAEVDAVDDATLEIGGDEFVGVIGPNGGGKSTLLQLVLGLLEPRRGTIDVFGRPPRRRGHGSATCLNARPSTPAFPRPCSTSCSWAGSRTTRGVRASRAATSTRRAPRWRARESPSSSAAPGRRSRAASGNGC